VKLLARRGERAARADEVATEDPWSVICRGTTPIADVRWRERARVAGRVRSVRVQPWAGVPTLECTLVDDTGGLWIVFLGRREVAGIGPGTRLVAEGRVGEHNRRLAILNPDYELMPTNA
jgi:RecG-like helicase